MSTITTKDQEISKAVASAISGIKDNPDSAKTSFAITSKLEEGFQARIDARDFNFVSDEPKDLGGSNQGPNPVEYVLGALAACQEIAIKTHASQLGIDLEAVEVTAEGDIDLHGFFDLSDERPGFKKVTYQTTIKSEEQDTAKLQKLKELSDNSCPVLDIIRNATPVSGNVQFVN